MYLYLLASVIILLGIFGIIYAGGLPHHETAGGQNIPVLQSPQAVHKAQARQQIQVVSKEQGLAEMVAYEKYPTEEQEEDGCSSVSHEQEKSHKSLRGKKLLNNRMKSTEGAPNDVRNELTEKTTVQRYLLENLKLESAIIEKAERAMDQDDFNGSGKDNDDLRLTGVTLAGTIQESTLDPGGRINTYEIFNVTRRSQHPAANSQEDYATEKEEQRKKRSRTSEKTNTTVLTADEHRKQEDEQVSTIKDLKDATQIDQMTAEEQLDNSLQKKLEADLANPDTCSIQMQMGEKTYRRRFLMSDTMEDVFNYASSQPEAPSRFGILTGSPNMIYHCKLQSDSKSQSLAEVGFHPEQVIFIVDEQREDRN